MESATAKVLSSDTTNVQLPLIAHTKASSEVQTGTAEDTQTSETHLKGRNCYCESFIFQVNNKALQQPLLKRFCGSSSDIAGIP